MQPGPPLIVLSSLFPSPEEPLSALFIRERMLRVARHLPVVIVAPVTWSPVDGLVRKFRPSFRRTKPVHTREGEVDVYRPRYLSVPGPIFLDGFAMACSVRSLIGKLLRERPGAVIDAHFAYPDGYAARCLARWFKVPYTVTLRGTEVRHRHDGLVRGKLAVTIREAARVFTVSQSLADLAVESGADASKVIVVPNGVDTGRFHPVPRMVGRERFGLPKDARVLLTVGGLVLRKGFHRVIEVLPQLREEFGDVRFLAVGGASREGDQRAELERLAKAKGVGTFVTFSGALPPEDLKYAYSAADVFVLASSNEGWANVLLESMACGTPVVASDVGGNREVVADASLGRIFDLDRDGALSRALSEALGGDFDREAILEHARQASWDSRVEQLLTEFRAISRA